VDKTNFFSEHLKLKDPIHTLPTCIYFNFTINAQISIDKIIQLPFSYFFFFVKLSVKLNLKTKNLNMLGVHKKTFDQYTQSVYWSMPLSGQY